MADVRHATVRVPATTANLGPGFDAFGAALGRHLAVRSEPRDAHADRVVPTGEGADEVARGDDNLVWTSLVRFCDEHGVGVPEVALRTANDIPLERGLGSSSAAIVAGLALGRALTEVPVGDRDLVELASAIEGHPDNVAPALLGGVVACAPPDDGALVVRRGQPAARLRPLLLVPESRQATTAARGVLPTSLPRSAVATQAARAGHVLAGLLGAWPVAPDVAGDLLHEPPRLDAMGPTGAVVTALRQAGVHAWLSGAGPAVAAAVVRGDDDPLTTCDELAAAHGFATWALDWDLAGTVVCPEGACAWGGRAGCVHCPSRTV